MSQKLSPEEKQVVDAIYMFTAQQMKNKVPNHKIEDSLVERGLDRQTAQIVISNLNVARKEALKKGAGQRMLRGGAICIIGILITAATYSAAQGGGTYVVAWGAIIFGGLEFFVGLAQSAS